MFSFQILIANNGIAAVKCMKSIREWSYEVFKNEKAIQFYAMVSEDDLSSKFLFAGMWLHDFCFFLYIFKT